MWRAIQSGSSEENRLATSAAEIQRTVQNARKSACPMLTRK
jgi:hypothetical protein